MTLAEIDKLIAPVSIAANALRRGWEQVPMSVRPLVPIQIRTPMQALFNAVETWDRAVGVAKDAGLMDRDLT